MARKKKRRNKIVEIGSGAAQVRIYTVNRSNGYPQYSIIWREGGRQRTRTSASMSEARLLAHQTSVRLTNGSNAVDEVTKRDIEMLRHCEQTAERFGLTLAAAIEEWASARKVAGEAALSDAVRFYQANRLDLLPVKLITEVVEEYLTSRRARGVTKVYVTRSEEYLNRFTGQVSGNIGDVTVSDINGFLQAQETLGPVTKNAFRTCLITMFGFAKRQGYLHPDRKTAAEQSESYKVPETEIEIFTGEEMKRLLLASHARIAPLVAIGAFAGIRSAEIRRLEWEDIKWDRGHIEIAGRKAKTAARRIVPLTDNLKAWLAPWRDETGPIITMRNVAGALTNLGPKAGVPGGWRKNALRHSYVSYRVALTGDVARTALEAGNSPEVIFRHYREVVDEQAAKDWFGIMPPEGWMPPDMPIPIRDRIARLAAEQEDGTVDKGEGA
ncbi:MAG: site-specific integrase [Verrucomicrobia bacterium]|nr:site-specific integrase [Verrucomicrobiota bacterium]MDA1006669.1 site-specific integrase [Verrucomicrobiota bacterium]